MSEEHTYERLYCAAIPSVVSVYVPGRGPGGAGGAGSGFVYDETGHVVTNHHVVGDADEVELRFSRGDWGVGRVVGRDAYTDLAVVRADDRPAYADPLAVAEENPRPGQAVAALGNPMGLDGTVTAGIVSGTERSMATGNGFAIPDTIQTDAPINPGNSGGPLVRVDDVEDGDRESGDRVVVVGVNRARQGDNIGFAVSPTIVGRVVPDLIEHGAYRHSYLKVRTIDVSPAVAEANGLDEPRGVLVADVSRGPARGVLRGCRGSRRVRGREVPVGGDVIVAVDGRPVRSHQELMSYLVTETRPGEPVEVALIRGGEETTETLTLGERPRPGGRTVPVR